MALFTKCILHEKIPQDGLRISIMSKHTLSNGKTQDRRITPEKFDEHLQALAPSPKLIGDYYKRGLPWKQFKQRYLEEIRKPETAYYVISLAKRSLCENVTILCIEETPECCHRRLLAEECRRLEPTLTVEHR